jgi:hypothetical protein
MREGLKPRRVANAMWDFSWLSQHYAGGAFANFDTAADALVERGFNTVRIDAFPLVIGALKSEDEAVTIAGDPLANWGMSDHDREHKIVAELGQRLQRIPGSQAGPGEGPCGVSPIVGADARHSGRA